MTEWETNKRDNYRDRLCISAGMCCNDTCEHCMNWILYIEDLKQEIKKAVKECEIMDSPWNDQCRYCHVNREEILKSRGIV